MSVAESALPTAPAVVRERPGGATMRAIVLEKFGGLDSLVYTDIPKPLPKDGEVVIEVRGFGINHAELHMRRGEWAEAAEVSGIECVGIVDSCPGGEFPVGVAHPGRDGALREVVGQLRRLEEQRARHAAHPFRRMTEDRIRRRSQGIAHGRPPMLRPTVRAGSGRPSSAGGRG